MSTIFLFDVDNTITPPRQKITDEMNEKITFMVRDAMDYVYLVTGSNIEKTNEQCGKDFLKMVDGTFANSGNSFYVGDRRVFYNHWPVPAEITNWLKSTLSKSNYLNKTGNHIELRPGSLNFSIVGRNANPKEREDYHLFDLATNDRANIAKLFNNKFPHLSAKIGGETGLDIAPKGNDKSQVFRYLAAKAFCCGVEMRIVFFGDKMMPGGNDEPLTEILKASWPEDKLDCIQVSGCDMTAQILDERYFNNGGKWK